MAQRNRKSVVLAFVGVAGLLVAGAAMAFSVVRQQHLAAAEPEAIVAVVDERPVASELSSLAPPQLTPVDGPQPLSPARPKPAPRLAGPVPVLQRVPAFTEMEAKAEAALEQPVTITFQDDDLSTALDKLSEQAGVPVRFSPGWGEISSEFDPASAGRITAEFQAQPVSSVLRHVFFKAFGLSEEELLEPGFSIRSASTPEGIECGLCGYGPASGRDTRIYLVSHLLNDPEDAQQILNLLYDRSGGYWSVRTDDGRGGIRINGSLMTTADDDDVLAMAQLAGSIVHLKSLGGLVVSANPQAHYEIVKTLRLLDEAYQVAADRKPH